MSQLADFLETHKRELLERWIARVDASMAPGVKSKHELADHMPQFTEATAHATDEYTRRKLDEATGSRRETSSLKGQLETMLLSIGDGVLATDAQGRVTFLNPVAESLTGWSSAQARQRQVSEVFRIVNEHTRETTPSPVDKVLRDGSKASLANHTLLLRKGGGEIPIDDSAAPIRDEQGVLTGVVLVFRDVSEKKKLEQEAAAERQKLHAVLELTPVAICILEGPEHVFTFVNPAYRAYASGRDLLNKPLLEALPELRGHGFDTQLDQVMSEGVPYFGNELPSKTEHKGAAGEMIVNFVSTPMRDAAGKISGVLVSVVDVSEQVHGRRRVEQLVKDLAGEREKLATIIRESPAAMCLWRGEEFVFELANERFEQVFGNRRLVGKTLEEGLPELTDQAFPALLRRVFETGEPFVGHEVLARIAATQGGPLLDHYYDFTYLRVDNADGSPYGVYDHSVDVTERVLARRNLEESQAGLQLALRGGQMGTWTILMADGTVHGDERFRQLHHVRDGEPIQEAIDRDAHPEDRARIREALASTVRDGTPYTCEYRVGYGGGEPRWVYARGEPRYDEGKKLVSISGIAFDIEERKQNEAVREQLLSAFRSSEENFRTLAEAIPQQVWTALPGGALDFVNRRVVDYFAVPREAILGAGWQEVLHPDDLADSARRWLQSLATGEQYETEFRLRSADGTYRWHLGRALASRDAQGRIVKWFGTNTDIDEAKKFREELEKRTDFEQHLLGIVSHDLRNPLSAILMSAATLLQMDDQSERATRIARRIHSSAERSGRMIRDLLDFTQARLGSGIPLQRKQADLYAVTGAALEEIEAVAPDRVTLRRAGDTQGFWDVDRLSQVVTNLVSNSLKYSPPGSPVAVRIEGGPDFAELSVHNQGAPIPGEQLDRIFEPLQRASDQIDRNDRSVGLGLYIVDAIVRAHGGTVRVESTVESGTIFTVRLPRRT
jgi:PAS domain S-box-containing protein